MSTALTERRDNAVAENGKVTVSMDTVQGFEALQRVAKLFSASDIVPPQYKSIANSVVAVDMAMRMGANPLMVMQNLYVVHNRPAWSAQFLIATFNKCGRFSSIRYEEQGEVNTDNWGCRAVATELATREILKGPLVTIALSKKEGWYSKNGSKWQTIPELMLRYRAATFLIRTVAPEIAMGLQTQEEVEDTIELALEDDGTYVVDDTAASPLQKGSHALRKKSGASKKEKLASAEATVIEDEKPQEAPQEQIDDTPKGFLTPAESKRRDDAYATLSAKYDGNERKIDDLLFKNGATDDLLTLKGTTDAKAIDAIVKTAAEF